MYDFTMVLNQSAIKTLKIIRIEAYKFLAKNSFFTYILGPERSAIAASRLSIAKVKHITNLAGISIISGAINTHRKIKNAAIPKAITPPM